MKIVETYSHLNGLEYLLVHKKPLWDEIVQVIGGIDAEAAADTLLAALEARGLEIVRKEGK